MEKSFWTNSALNLHNCLLFVSLLKTDLQLRIACYSDPINDVKYTKADGEHYQGQLVNS